MPDSPRTPPAAWLKPNFVPLRKIFPDLFSATKHSSIPLFLSYLLYDLTKAHRPIVINADYTYAKVSGKDMAVTAALELERAMVQK